MKNKAIRRKGTETVVRHHFPPSEPLDEKEEKKEEVASHWPDQGAVALRHQGGSQGKHSGLASTGEWVAVLCWV